MKAKILLDIEIEVVGESPSIEEIKKSLESAFLHDAPSVITVDEDSDIIVNSIEIETDIYD